jgi:hypothetical protein
MIFGSPGAPKTPEIDNFRPAPNSCIKNPGVQAPGQGTPRIPSTHLRCSLCGQVAAGWRPPPGPQKRHTGGPWQMGHRRPQVAGTTPPPERPCGVWLGSTAAFVAHPQCWSVVGSVVGSLGSCLGAVLYCPETPVCMSSRPRGTGLGPIPAVNLTAAGTTARSTFKIEDPSRGPGGSI